MSEIYTYVEPKLHGSVQERMARMKFNVSKAIDKAVGGAKSRAKLSHVQDLDKMGTPRRPYTYLTNVNP